MLKPLLSAALVCAGVILLSGSIAAGETSVKLKAEVPYREDSGLTKAEYYLSKEKYAETLAEATNVIKRHPQSADAYTYRGLAYDRLGETEKAVRDFKKALLISPTHMGANKYLADIYLSEGDLPRAIEQMQVLRMACADAGCPELEELQASVNKYKKKKKSEAEEEE